MVEASLYMALIPYQNIAIELKVNWVTYELTQWFPNTFWPSCDNNFNFCASAYTQIGYTQSTSASNITDCPCERNVTACWQKPKC